MTLDQWASQVAQQALLSSGMPLGSKMEDSIAQSIKANWDCRPNENQSVIDKSMRDFNEQRDAALKRVTDEQSR